MSVEHFNPDYPEHLNPFHKRRNTLTRSFRGIKNAIVKSLTGKEKEKPVLRPKQGTELTKRAVFSMPPTVSTDPPIALPRSRFSERLTKTDAIRASTINKKSIAGNVEHNPFDDGAKHEPNNDNVEDTSLLTPPKPTARLKHKKKKKKIAPIPPGSVGGSVSGSKWSLDSTESDMSSIGFYSEADIDYIDRSTGDHEEILNLTREIAKFAEDTNNNSIPNDVPDGTVKESDKCDNLEEAPNIDKEAEIKNVEITVTVTDENVTTTSKDECINEQPVEEPITPENNAESSKDPHSSQEISESLKQDQNYLNNNSVSVEETAVELRLDNINTVESTDRLSVQQAIEHYENTPASPTPKVRKNILTKENLLGSEET